MGVPAFYRWLREKYPHCIEDCVEEEPAIVDGFEVPINISAANPNKIEFDNLYLDMNGIIHPCVHPEDAPAPETLDEMFQAICEYIDRLVAAVRPRRLLFLAIDGVAPRAKMNQQRSRRFKAAQEMAEEEQVEEEMRGILRSKGHNLPPKKKSTFDHNVITPGTEFMDRLSRHLAYHVVKRQAGDAGWRGLKVILSDASVPGEGEHKIMEFVRQQRSQPGYNPNVSHCLHGLDADLIMLGLATHEPHFTILREDILGKPSSKCFVCGRDGHQAKQCTGVSAEPAEPELTSVGHRGLIQRKPLQFLHLSTLREYLDIEFRVAFGVPPPPPGLPTGLVTGNPAAGASAALPFGYDLENAIDDFVFLCFFVGNDFLPHLPSMDIREGAIDLLMALYKLVLPTVGGYLTHSGTINLARADVLLARVGGVEDEIFRRRRIKEERDKRRDEQQAVEAAAAKQRLQQQREAQAALGGGQTAADVLELAIMSAAGGVGPRGSPAPVDGGAQGQKAAARRVLEASVASVEAERAAMGAVPAVIHQAVTAGLGARVEVVRADATAAVAGLQQRVASLLPKVEGQPADLAGSIKPDAATEGAGGGKADAVNRSAAAALRSRLLGRPPPSEAQPPAPAVASISAGLAAVDSVGLASGGEELAGSSGDSHLAGTKRRRDDDSELAVVDAVLAASDVVQRSSDANPGSGTAGGIALDVGTADDAADDDLFAAPLAPDELKVLEEASGAPPFGFNAPEPTAALDIAGSSAASDPAPDDSPDAPDEIDDEIEEALPIDPCIVPGIDSMLRGAVLKTIQAKRTHVGAEDNVRFGAAGWKERYYVAKFGAEAGADAGFRKAMVTRYIEGLCWVLKYYYSGVASWGWFFPYHYAPFASDLRNIDREVIKFELGAPFAPMAQLMGVLPPRSAHALPPAIQVLMTDPSSAIADFYPTRFDMDPNGKRFTWQWVVLLPFIDEARLMVALRSVESTFSPEERRRNRMGTDLLFVHVHSPLGGRLQPLLLREEPQREGAETMSALVTESTAGAPSDVGLPVVAASLLPAAQPVVTVKLRPDDDVASQKGLSGAAMSLAEGGAGARGLFAPQIGGIFKSPWNTVCAKGEDVRNVQTVLVVFLSPPRRPHRCALLPGALPPPRILEDGRDDPSSRVPKLSRGMNVADLAYVGEPAAGRSGRGGGGPFQQQPLQVLQWQQQQQQWAGAGSRPAPGPPYMQPSYPRGGPQAWGAGPPGTFGGPAQGQVGLRPGYAPGPPQPPQQAYSGGPPQYAFSGGPPQHAYTGGPPQYAYSRGPPQYAYSGGPPQYAYPGAGASSYYPLPAQQPQQYHQAAQAARGPGMDVGVAQRMIHAVVGRPPAPPAPVTLPRPFGPGGIMLAPPSSQSLSLQVTDPRVQNPGQNRFSFAPGGAARY